MNIAVLSNINVDPVIKIVKKFATCYTPFGYGNVLETLLDPNSCIYTNSVETIYILMDVMELVHRVDAPKDAIRLFFRRLKDCVKPQYQYFVGTGDCYPAFSYDYATLGFHDAINRYWDDQVASFCEASNCFVFPYGNLAGNMGRNNFYAEKGWYLGSVRHSLAGCKAIGEEIRQTIRVLEATPKKVLLLDLDNTLWGGVIGEDGPEGIHLSDSGMGRAYVDFQEILLEIKKRGVILGIVSKNNEKDALAVLENHPHMVLKPGDFTIRKINWEPKSRNVAAIAKELNVGLASIVFVDDNPVEREEVRQVLPGENVPEFPQSPEGLVAFGQSLVNRFFIKLSLQKEDLEKAAQYEAKLKIDRLFNESTDMASFLAGLRIRLTQMDPGDNVARIQQLFQKTNQFNTSLIRYTLPEAQKMLGDGNFRFFLFQVADKFTNHGICVLALVSLAAETPFLDSFVMSCRVMGRKIEYGVLAWLEKWLAAKGFSHFTAQLVEGEKNMPARQFFEEAGFAMVAAENGKRLYQRSLAEERESPFMGEIISLEGGQA